MKVMPTHYAGHIFRSRIEARYAVFLEELFWDWIYEKEGFVLSNGVPYLPDFYLPQIDVWMEIKGAEFKPDEINKCRLLSLMFPESTVIMAAGLPDKRPFPCFCNGGLLSATLTTYIRAKGWSAPYFNGDWWSSDDAAFDAARFAKFEFGIKGIYKTK